MAMRRYIQCMFILLGLILLGTLPAGSAVAEEAQQFFTIKALELEWPDDVSSFGGWSWRPGENVFRATNYARQNAMTISTLGSGPSEIRDASFMLFYKKNCRTGIGSISIEVFIWRPDDRVPVLHRAFQANCDGQPGMEKYEFAPTDYEISLMENEKLQLDVSAVFDNPSSTDQWLDVGFGQLQLLVPLWGRVYLPNTVRSS